MIGGTFHDDAPYVTLTLRGEGDDAEVEFIVDTGFAGVLAAPRSVLQQIGAILEGSELRRLADDTHRRFAVYTVTVAQDEEGRSFQVLEKDGDPLLGTGFLREQHLHIEVTEGGEVLSEPL